MNDKPESGLDNELDSELLEILVCPEDKGKLWYLKSEEILYNPRLKRKYQIREGIPIMLIDEATSVEDQEHQRLVDLASQLGLAQD